MPNYIDQAVAVCDALIVQAKANREGFGRAFAPVSAAEERLRIGAEIAREERGISLEQMQKEYDTLQSSFLEKLNPQQRKWFHSKSPVHNRQLIKDLRQNDPLLNDEFEGLLFCLRALQTHVTNQTPEKLDKYLNEFSEITRKGKAQRIEAHFQPRVLHDEMVETIISHATARQLKAEGVNQPEQFYDVGVGHNAVVIDTYHDAPPLDLIRLRDDIDKNLRKEFADASKWQRLRGKQNAYVLKVPKPDSVFKVMNAYHEMTGKPAGMSILGEEGKHIVIVRGNSVIRNFLNEGFGLDLPLEAKEKGKRQR